MEIKSSEIWYTYTSSYSGPVLSLDVFAYAFIKSKITKCVFHTQGKYYFEEDHKIVSRDVDLKIDPRLKNGKYSMQEWPNDAFSKEMLYQNYINGFFERIHFAFDNKYIDHEYIRFSLGEILIIDGNSKKRLYVFVNFYSSGVIIIEFRVIYNYSIELDKYIHECVNLSMMEFDKCYVDEALFKYVDCSGNGKRDDEKIVDSNDDFTFRFSLLSFSNE